MVRNTYGFAIPLSFALLSLGIGCSEERPAQTRVFTKYVAVPSEEGPDQSDDGNPDKPLPSNPEPAPVKKVGFSVSLAPTNISNVSDTRFPRGARLANGNLIIAFIEYTADARSIKTEISTDDGATWKAWGTIIRDPLRTDVPETVGDPTIVVLPSGKLLAAYRNLLTDNSHRLQVAVSADEGATWAFQSDVEVSPTIEGRSMLPTFSVNSKGQAQIYYTKPKAATGGETQIVMKTSLNEGRTWANQVTVATRAEGGSSFPAVQRLNDGSILAVFDTFRSETNKLPILRSVQSSDDGLTWSSPKDVYIPTDASKRAQSPQMGILEDGRPFVAFVTDENLVASQGFGVKVLVAANAATFNSLQWSAQAVAAFSDRSLLPAILPAKDGAFYILREIPNADQTLPSRVSMNRATIDK